MNMEQLQEGQITGQEKLWAIFIWLSPLVLSYVLKQPLFAILMPVFFISFGSFSSYVLRNAAQGLFFQLIVEIVGTILLIFVLVTRNALAENLLFTFVGLAVTIRIIAVIFILMNREFKVIFSEKWMQNILRNAEKRKRAKKEKDENK